jgi:hypothetical protein
MGVASDEHCSTVATLARLLQLLGVLGRASLCHTHTLQPRTSTSLPPELSCQPLHPPVHPLPSEGVAGHNLPGPVLDLLKVKSLRASAYGAKAYDTNRFDTDNRQRERVGGPICGQLPILADVMLLSGAFVNSHFHKCRLSAERQMGYTLTWAISTGDRAVGRSFLLAKKRMGTWADIQRIVRGNSRWKYACPLVDIRVGVHDVSMLSTVVPKLFWPLQ